MIVAAPPTDLDSLRLRNEFLEMPELSISVSQVARMLGLRSDMPRPFSRRSPMRGS